MAKITIAYVKLEDSCRLDFFTHYLLLITLVTNKITELQMDVNNQIIYYNHTIHYSWELMVRGNFKSQMIPFNLLDELHSIDKINRCRY